MRNLSARTLPFALLAGAVLIGLYAAIQPAADIPPFNPAGDQAAYDRQTPLAVTVVEPIVHAPWRGQAPAAIGGLLAALLALAGMAAAQAFGAAPGAALAVIAAVVLSAPLAATVRHAGPASLALLCVWTAWLVAARREDATPVGPRLILATVVIAAGGWWHWTVLLGLPLIASVIAAETSRAVRARLAGLIALSAAAAIALYVWHVTGLARDAMAPAPWSIGVGEVWRALNDDLPRQGRVMFVAPDWGPAWSALGLALAAVGFAAPLWPGRLRAGLAATIAAVAVAAAAYGDSRDELARFVAWMIAPVAAVGLTWIARQAAPTRQPWVTTGLAIVLVTDGLTASSRPPGVGDVRLFAEKFAASLADAVAAAGVAPPAIVAEDTIVDSAVVTFGGGLSRIPQDADVAARSWSAGSRVMAGPTGRRHLEMFGLVFHRAVTIAEPVRFEWAAVVDRYRCDAVRDDRWSLLPGLEFTGRIGLQVPAGLGGELQVIVGDTLPVALRAERPDGSPAAMKIERLLNGPSVNTPPPDYWFDGGTPQDAPAEIVRATIAAHPAAEQVLALHLGRRAPRVLARLRGYPAGAVGRVCAASLGVDRLFASQEVKEEQVPIVPDSVFGAGWHGVEGRAPGAFRWSTGDAVVLAPLERRGALRVTAKASPAITQGDAPELTLSVNGVAQARVPMRPGVADYAWDVAARAWVTGVNDLHFHVSRTVRPADLGAADTRVLGMALHELKLSRLP